MLKFNLRHTKGIKTIFFLLKKIYILILKRSIRALELIPNSDYIAVGGNGF